MSRKPVTGDRQAIALGAASGIVAWLVGYGLTYLLVAEDVQESGIQQFIEAIAGEPATYEMVGWVFYNAHFVDTVYTGVPVIGEFTTNAVSGEDGLSFVLYLIPVALLVAAGLAVAQYRGCESPTDGLLTGLTVLPGYLILTVVGIFLFEVSLGGATGGPRLLDSIFLAGLVYPAAFAGVGGVLASVTE